MWGMVVTSTFDLLWPYPTLQHTGPRIVCNVGGRLFSHRNRREKFVFRTESMNCSPSGHKPIPSDAWVSSVISTMLEAVRAGCWGTIFRLGWVLQTWKRGGWGGSNRSDLICRGSACGAYPVRPWVPSSRTALGAEAPRGGEAQHLI